MAKRCLFFILVLIFSLPSLAENTQNARKYFFDDSVTLDKKSILQTGAYFSNGILRQLPSIKSKKEFDSLVDVLMKSANNGFVPAYYALGTIYESKFRDGSIWLHSQGTLEDLKNAIKYYKKAAPFTSAAENELGQIYLADENLPNKYKPHNDSDRIKSLVGVLPNIDEAIYWLDRAAKHGHPAAQGTLSDLYLQGIGVPQDFVIAYVWQNLSTASHYRFNKPMQITRKEEWTKAFLSATSKETQTQYSKLTVMQKNEAQNSLREYTKQYFVPPSDLDKFCSVIQLIVFENLNDKILNYIKTN